jgi:lipooligosaccharide transport system permease protein
LSELPEWAQIAGAFNPLHHCVELVRHAAFGWDRWDPLRVVALIAFGLTTWRIAIYAMTRKLID